MTMVANFELTKHDGSNILLQDTVTADATLAQYRRFLVRSI